MADPITNDYATVIPLSEREQRRAVLTTVSRAAELVYSRSEARDLLDALGITPKAVDIQLSRRRRKIPAPVSPLWPGDVGRPTAVSEPVGPLPMVRPCKKKLHDMLDPVHGRRRFDGRYECRTCEKARDEAAKANKPTPARVCQTAGHDMSPGSPNRYVSPTGDTKCKACRQVRERARRAKERQARELVKVPVDPNLCHCPGEKHQLRTGPNGKRYCPVSVSARRKVDRAKAAAARAAATPHEGDWAEESEAS